MYKYLVQSLTIIKNIFYHPSNKSERFKRIIRFFKWQIFKRIWKVPVLAESGEKIFIAYSDCTYSSMLFYFKTPEYEELNILKGFNNVGSAIFLDVGSNIGYYSVMLGNLFSSVHAFEPNPTAMKRLKVNALLNDIHVHTNQVGISSETGQMYLALNESVDPTAHLVSTSGGNTIGIYVITLDSYIEMKNLKGDIVMKVDVEGFELEVLKGAKKSLLKKMFSIIQIECLDDETFKTTWEYSRSVDYLVYCFERGKLSKVFEKKTGIQNYYLLPR